MKKVRIAYWDELKDRQPDYALVADVDTAEADTLFVSCTVAPSYPMATSAVTT